MFAGWGGDCSGAGACVVTMDAPRTVNATFNLEPTFAFGTPPPPVTVSAGQQAAFVLTVNPQNGTFNSAITFSCTGVPSLASCVFSPASVTPGASPATTTLTISTSAPITAALLRESSIFALWLPLPLALLGWNAARRVSRRQRVLGLIGLGMLLTLAMAGCGGSSGSARRQIPGTPAGTYNVTVTGTSGATTRTTTVTLTVR